MILMIDNYDSFTYNVVQYLGELGANVKVVRNDMISIKDIEYMEPEKIVISPGHAHQKKRVFLFKRLTIFILNYLFSEFV